MSIKKDEIIFSFYLIPFFLSISIRILSSCEFHHFATGLVFKHFQAIFVGLVLLFIVIHIVYVMFYKIPKIINKNDNYNIKIVIKGFINSSFAYSLFIIIIYQLFLRFYLSKYLYVTLFAILLLLNFYTQRNFLKMIEKYIFKER